MKDISIEGRCPKCGDTEHLVLRMFDDEEDEEDEFDFKYCSICQWTENVQS